MEGEGSGAAGRAMAQNVEDGLEGMRSMSSFARSASLPAGVYPHAAENPHVEAVQQLLSMWRAQQDLPEEALDLACANKAGGHGAAWSVVAILALFHCVLSGNKSLSHGAAAEAVLKLDHSNSLRTALENGKNEGSGGTSLTNIYRRFITPGAKAPAWWENGIEAWKRGGWAGQALKSSRLCRCRRQQRISTLSGIVWVSLWWHSLIKRRTSLRSRGILPSLQHLLSCPSSCTLSRW
jgi:hypothetical protein